MFSSHVILDFRVEDYLSLTKETEVSPFCHNQNSNFLESELEPKAFVPSHLIMKLIKSCQFSYIPPKHIHSECTCHCLNSGLLTASNFLPLP